MSNSISLPALVDRARQGDSAAFDVLAGHFRPKLAGFFYRQGSGPDAEDLAQETLIRAFRAIDTHHGTSFAGWLFKIASNLNIDRTRSIHRQHSTVSLDAPLGSEENTGVIEVPDSRHEPARTAERAELRAIVAEAMAALPEHHRAVLVMREVYGMDYAAIAEETGLPLGTVKSRIFHARAEVGRRLRPYMSGAK